MLLITQISRPPHQFERHTLNYKIRYLSRKSPTLKDRIKTTINRTLSQMRYTCLNLDINQSLNSSRRRQWPLNDHDWDLPLLITNFMRQQSDWDIHTAVNPTDDKAVVINCLVLDFFFFNAITINETASFIWRKHPCTEELNNQLIYFAIDFPVLVPCDYHNKPPAEAAATVTGRERYTNPAPCETSAITSRNH